MIRGIIRKLIKAEDGVTVVEYGLISALFGIVAITEIMLTGAALQAMFQGPAAAMDPVAMIAQEEGNGNGNGNGN
ncbi:MAG: Flp family type IVb pilin [Proteobacteria bacterium]|nr:Flp family type IVb pilin [Pseudomonadota bacterium]